MGFSSQRQSAARTILRARLIGNAGVISDAENSTSYLGEDADEYLTEHFPNGLDPDDAVVALVAQAAGAGNARRQAEHYKSAAIRTESDIHDTLAAALGYPSYPPGSPGYSPERVNYVTGDHVAASLASQAAARILQLESELAEAHDAAMASRN